MVILCKYLKIMVNRLVGNYKVGNLKSCCHDKLPAIIEHASFTFLSIFATECINFKKTGNNPDGSKLI